MLTAAVILINSKKILVGIYRNHNELGIYIIYEKVRGYVGMYYLNRCLVHINNYKNKT